MMNYTSWIDWVKGNLKGNPAGLYVRYTLNLPKREIVRSEKEASLLWVKAKIKNI